MTRTGCQLCQGSKHLWTGDRWIDCDCLKREHLQRVLQGAGGMRLTIRRTELRNLRGVNVIKLAAAATAKQTFMVAVEGGGMQERAAVALEFMRQRVDQQATVESVTLNQLIDWKFDKEIDRSGRLKRVGALWIQADTAREHKWRRTVLTEMLMARTQRSTIITWPMPIPLDLDLEVIRL